MVYMLTFLGYIDGIHVTIYSIHGSYGYSNILPIYYQHLLGFTDFLSKKNYEKNWSKTHIRLVRDQPPCRKKVSMMAPTSGMTMRLRTLEKMEALGLTPYFFIASSWNSPSPAVRNGKIL